MIQNKLRNRLGLQTTNKLVIGYKMLHCKGRDLDPEVCEDY